MLSSEGISLDILNFFKKKIRRLLLQAPEWIDLHQHSFSWPSEKGRKHHTTILAVYSSKMRIKRK